MLSQGEHLVGWCREEKTRGDILFEMRDFQDKRIMQF